MKAGRALIGIFRKMRIKNLREEVSEVRFKKTRFLHLGNVENHLIRNFLRNGCVRVKLQIYKRDSTLQIQNMTQEVLYPRNVLGVILACCIWRGLVFCLLLRFLYLFKIEIFEFQRKSNVISLPRYYSHARCAESCGRRGFSTFPR